MPSMTAARQREIAQAREAEDAARLQELYGRHLDDVMVLRKAGFVVTKEGRSFLVGNKNVDGATLTAMADRERRLARPSNGSAARATPTGLKIGDKVALSPKKRVYAPVERPAARPTTPPAKAVITARAIPSTGPRKSEHSAELGSKPRVVWLDLGILKVDKRYQRDVGLKGEAHIRNLLRKFNWNCYQPIIVTEREDGTYAVIDGQHRLAAAKRHPLVDSLPCYIVNAPDVAAQAAIFTAVNSVRLALTSQQKFWASYSAGDPTAITLHKICKDAGVTILRAPPSGTAPAMSLLAPIVCQKMIVKLGAEPVRAAIGLLAAAHPTTPMAFRSHFIAALARIAADKEFSRDKYLRLLQRTDLSKLQQDALVGAAGGGAGGRARATETILRKAA